MVRATLHIRVVPGQERAFELAWSKVAAYASRQPGNLRQTLLRDRSEDGSYYINSDWISAAAFKAFERSPEQDLITRRCGSLRQSATMTISEILTEVGGTGATRRARLKSPRPGAVDVHEIVVDVNGPAVKTWAPAEAAAPAERAVRAA